MAKSEDPHQALAVKAAAGDRKALRALLRSVGPSMTAIVRKMVPPSDVDDAAQEALLALTKALPSFRQESSVRHFACRVAVRSTTVFNRSRFRRGRADDRGRTDVEQQEAPPSPAEATASERRRSQLRELCAKLPEEQAEALSLRIVLGHSLQEVAEATGAPVNTVRSRLRLAKAALRRRIEDDPEVSESLGVAKP